MRHFPITTLPETAPEKPVTEQPTLTAILAQHDLEDMAAPWETTTMAELVNTDPEEG